MPANGKRGSKRAVTNTAHTRGIFLRRLFKNMPRFVCIVKLLLKRQKLFEFLKNKKIISNQNKFFKITIQR